LISAVIALACFTSSAVSQDTTARADSIRRLKAEQQPLPVDPRERHADSVDDGGKTLLAIVQTRGYGIVWFRVTRALQ
jgi:hypothetical protein